MENLSIFSSFVTTQPALAQDPKGLKDEWLQEFNNEHARRH